MGYGLTIKDSIVMVWGGLRGAIGLALAIIVELDKDMLPPGFRALVMFHMGVTVIFTLIINGSTMPYLLSYLGTTKTSPEKLEVLLHVVKVRARLGQYNFSKFNFVYKAVSSFSSYPNRILKMLILRNWSLMLSWEMWIQKR